MVVERGNVKMTAWLHDVGAGDVNHQVVRLFIAIANILRCFLFLRDLGKLFVEPARLVHQRVHAVREIHCCFRGGGERLVVADLGLFRTPFEVGVTLVGPEGWEACAGDSEQDRGGGSPVPGKSSAGPESVNQGGGSLEPDCGKFQPGGAEPGAAAAVEPASRPAWQTTQPLTCSVNVCCCSGSSRSYR